MHNYPHTCPSPQDQAYRLRTLGIFSKLKESCLRIYYYFNLERTYAVSWSYMAQPCDIDLWVIKWRSAWPIFHGPVILSYILRSISCMYIILWDYESIWPKVWPKSRYRSLWLIFHGPVILCHIWQFDVWTPYFGISGQYDTTFDLKISVGLCDLYFMAQRFCRISSVVFDVCHIFRYWDSETQTMSTWLIFHSLVILLNIF